MGFGIFIASQAYTAARKSGMSATTAYQTHIAPLSDKREAIWAGLLLRNDRSINVTRVQNDDNHVTTTITADGTVVLNRQFRTKSKFARTIEKVGVGAISGVIGFALGSAAFNLGKAAIGNLFRANFGTALLQAGGASAIASLGPGLASRAFGGHADFARRWMGYGVTASTIYHLWNVDLGLTSNAHRWADPTLTGAARAKLLKDSKDALDNIRKRNKWLGI